MIDCACVITGDKYDFEYVHKLYNGLTRGFTDSVTLHVYTEGSREVPKPYVKHTLKNFKTRSDRGWWHKVQLFDPSLFNGQLVYFDLDVVITGNLDWILGLDTKYFWGIRDFRYLWSKRKTDLNSSVMYFNTDKFRYVWQEFKQMPEHYMNRMHGDQNYIQKRIPDATRRSFDEMRVKSYKWELLDGGWDNDLRRHKTPGAGTAIPHETSIAIFHGKPNPDEVCQNNPIIAKYWC
jgi:hypothetical protein